MHYRALLAVAALALAGCGNANENIALGVIGSTLVGAQAPNNEIQQIYYLGVFDPQDQLPPAVYRVRVHGQASFLNQAKFASGWAPAALVDSLSTHISFPKTGGPGIAIDKGAPTNQSSLGSAHAFDQTHRKLVLFGPEGFREAPKDHRLVIVMGASPEAFFEGIDSALGSVSGFQAEQRDDALARKLLAAHLKLVAERRELDDLRKDAEVEFESGAGK